MFKIVKQAGSRMKKALKKLSTKTKIKKSYTRKEVDQMMADAVSNLTKKVKENLELINLFNDKLNDLLQFNKTVAFYKRGGEFFMKIIDNDFRRLV